MFSQGRAVIKMLAAVAVLGAVAVGGVVYVDMLASTRQEDRADIQTEGDQAPKVVPAKTDPARDADEGRP